MIGDMPGAQPRVGLPRYTGTQSVMSSRAPNTQPMIAPTPARTSRSRQPVGARPRQSPANPAATPTHPSANAWYGTQGPTPPPAIAETRIERAPARNPKELPKT